MIKHIVGVGCSWIAGDEIEHPSAAPDSKEFRRYREKNCTLGQLASKIGVPISKVCNLGISGGSLQSTQWEFSKWMLNQRKTVDFANQEILIVVGYTEASRASWFNNNKNSHYMHSHWVHPGNPWEDFLKFYTVHADNVKLWAHNYWLTVNFFQSYCKVHEYPLLDFNIFPPPIKMSSVPNWNARGYVHHLNQTHQDLLAPGHHANEKGSELLAQRLYNHLIDAKILA